MISDTVQVCRYATLDADYTRLLSLILLSDVTWLYPYVFMRFEQATPSPITYNPLEFRRSKLRLHTCEEHSTGQ